MGSVRSTGLQSGGKLSAIGNGSLHPHHLSHHHGGANSTTSATTKLFRIRDLRYQLLVWRAVALGISFLSLILVSSRLHGVSKEVKFLQSMGERLPKFNSSSPSPSVTSTTISSRLVIETLRHDIDYLIIELWSARNSLILAVIYIVSYILSWLWMIYQLNMGVSLKCIILLVVFAAVDIAASTGFIMIRLMMTLMGGSSSNIELTSADEILSPLTSLKLSVLQSNSGSIDVFISGMAAFLTGVRVYIVICAVSFYNRLPKTVNGQLVGAVSHHSLHHHHHNSHQIPSSVIHRISPPPPPPPPSSPPILRHHHHLSSPNDESESQRSVKLTDDIVGNGHINRGLTTSPFFISNNKNGHNNTLTSNRKYSATATESLTGDDSDSNVAINSSDFKIQAADMPLYMQRTAMSGAIQACRLYTTEKHIAESIKQDFDQMFGPTWHCIVGRNWGSCVTHSKQCYIRILYKDLTLLLYKSS